MSNYPNRFGNKQRIITESTLSTDDRKDLKASDFGLPDKRKYPLTDETHVLQAVRFFNKCKEKSKPELAKNIVRRAKELNMEWEKWGSVNKYLDKNIQESVDNYKHDEPVNIKMTCELVDDKFYNNEAYDYKFYNQLGDREYEWVGHCYIINNTYPKYSFDSYYITPGIWIHDFVIDDKYRNKGIASYVMKYMIDKHKIDNIACSSTNEIALHLYDKFGFKQYEQRDDMLFLKRSNEQVQESVERLNDKGDTVPEICDKCGGKISLYIKGEPVWLCSKCNKYYGTLPFNTVQEGVFNDIKRGVNPKSNKLFFHISFDGKLNDEILKPRIPIYMNDPDYKPLPVEDDYYENTTTKRVCFSPSIEGCLNAMINYSNRLHLNGKDIFVYIPEKEITDYEHKTNKDIIKDKDVFDARITNEMWILEPVKLKLYGVIAVDQVSDVKERKRVNGNSIGRFDFKWHWSVKHNVAIISAPKQKKNTSETVQEMDNNDLTTVSNVIDRNNFDILEYYKMIIIGEKHSKEMIRYYDKLLSVVKPEYFICEFADTDRCLDQDTLASRMANATNGSFEGNSADYQYNYAFYQLAYKHNCKLIGCNKPPKENDRTMETEDRVRENYMLDVLRSYEHAKCVVQLGDHHLRSIPITNDFLKYTNDIIDDRGLVDDLTVSFASPIWDYFKNKQYCAICREPQNYMNEINFVKSTNLHVQESVNDITKTWKEIPITKEVVDKYKSGHGEFDIGMKHMRVNDKTTGAIFVDSNDIVIGYIGIESKPNNEIWITALEVSKEYQGKGIGGVILNIAVTKFNAKFLSVNKNNTRALELYKLLGWVIYDDVKSVYFMKYIGISAHDNKNITMEGIDKMRPNRFATTSSRSTATDDVVQESMFDSGFSNLRHKIATNLGDKFKVSNIMRAMGSNSDKFYVTLSDDDSKRLDVISTGNGVKVPGHFTNVALSKAFDVLMDLFTSNDVLTENFKWNEYDASCIQEEDSSTLTVDDDDTDDDVDYNKDSTQHNEYDPSDVETLNDLIADEAAAMDGYFEGAKKTNVDVLRRLYSDIGNEERYHLEQLMFAKSTLVGDKYVPQDPDVRKEYDELLSMGMDEETALGTAVDKLNIRGMDDDDIDFSDLQEDIEIAECAINQFETNCDLLSTIVDVPNWDSSMSQHMSTFVESFCYLEGTDNVALNGNNKTSINPIKIILNGFMMLIKFIQHLIKLVQNIIRRVSIKQRHMTEWLKTHDIKDIFASGVSLYFYSDKNTSTISVAPMQYTDLLYKITKEIAKKLNITIPNMTNDFHDPNPIRFNTIERGLEIAKGVVLTKTKVVVNDANKENIKNYFFGETKMKFELTGESSNIYTLLEAVSSYIEDRVKGAEVLVKQLQSLQDNHGSIYYTDKEAYNKAINGMKTVRNGFSIFTKAISHDLNVITKLNDGILEKTRENDAANNNNKKDVPNDQMGWS